MAPDAALSFLTIPAPPDHALASLGQPLSAWFRRTFGKPTAAQCFAWPRLVQGENLLLAAPTGSGKTLAAFLPIVRRLCEEPIQRLACLYIAPLKALSRDVGKNLRRHFDSLAASFVGLSANIRVGLRTGDSSAKVRRQQLERPPHILLTTPESLAILLSQPRWCDVFRELRWVVVDEVHALIGSKRGADLALSLERLESIISESCPQRSLVRIGLSATCAPLDVAARFLVGTGRLCTIAGARDCAPMELIVEPLPVDDREPGRPFGFMARLLQRLTKELLRNRTTLIFANIRSLAERLTWTLRQRLPAWKEAIAVHHSSLAAPGRRQVERQLKNGLLRVVVSSASLELGIDIGTVDSVVFVHPPGGVARTVQRLGRSGHKPGQPRRGLFLTAGPAELLEATVTAASSHSGQLERLKVVDQPLDVLCQHLVGMSVTGWRQRQDALSLVRRAHPYRNLSDEDYDNCLAYLTGRRHDGQNWLPPRLRWHDDSFAIINEATARLLRRNLGSIINEEPRAIRRLLPDARADEVQTAAVGSLEEIYADRLRPGDRFVLDGRCYEFRRVEDHALLVEEVAEHPHVPKWTSGGWSLAPELAQRVFLFRLRAAEALREGKEAFTDLLQTEYRLDGAGQSEMMRFVLMQEMVSEIPALDSLFVEGVQSDAGAEYYFHTPLSRSANDAIARVLAARIERTRGWHGQIVVADLGFMLSLPTCQPIMPDNWRLWLEAEGFQTDLQEAVRRSESFRDRFARVAMTGLMVLRRPWGGRRKVGGRDWVERRLFEQVRRLEPNFVLLRQAEREMHSQVCDAPTALAFLSALPRMDLRCRWLSKVSPFAAAWTQPAEVGDEPPDDPHEVLARLQRELVGPHSLRPCGA